MIKRLAKGIVIDVTVPEDGSPVKMSYEPAQYDAIESAGFQSVRFYVAAGRNPLIYQRMIDDALDRGLAVVITLWGKSQWEILQEQGIQDFVNVWDEFARAYQDYPEDLVFELWNEPGGLTIKDGKPSGIDDAETVMVYLNAVIPVIRATNPDRILGIGGPGLNDADKLEAFVTPDYLTYRLSDGTGFVEDNHIIGCFHMYDPVNFTYWTLGLNQVPGWDAEVSNALSHASAWSEKWQKPVLLSEWGAWSVPEKPIEDYKTYLKFVVEECKKQNIEWIYYTMGYNNQWAFNILHTEYGWNQDALDILTGITLPQTPPLSPIINGEFGWATDNWTPKGTVKLSVNQGARLSGPTALRVTVTQSNHAEIYQNTPSHAGSPPGRTLISMKQGMIYKLSFLAKAVSGTGSIRVRFADVLASRNGFWTSESIAISNQKEEVVVEYRHTGMNINDVRVSFLFDKNNQDVLLDRIALHSVRE